MELEADARVAAQHYEQLGDPAVESLRAFWVEFQEEGNILSLMGLLRQLDKLVKLVKPAMQRVFKSLWPEDVG